MPNFKAAISRHNQKVLKESQAKDTQAPSEPGCNCITGPCPLVSNNCTDHGIHGIYRATVIDQSEKKIHRAYQKHF